MWKQIVALCLLAIGLVLVAFGDSFSAEANQTFTETVDGTPSSPQPWEPSNWEITSYNKNPAHWSTFDAVDGDYGTGCEALPATHSVTTFADSVYNCDGRVMTSHFGDWYSMAVMTPNQIVDFSSGEATISFDVSTHRSSGFDFIDFWITPYDKNLQIPAIDWLPGAAGPPEDAVHFAFDISSTYTRLKGDVVRDFAKTDLSDNYNSIENVLSANGLSTSKTRLDTIELKISANTVSACMPAYNQCFISQSISPALDWTSGVVQFSHHSFNPSASNTWHWDNFSISPATEFSIVQATSGFANASSNTISFESAAPANANLRFIGIGESMQVSFDGGSTWQAATEQSQDASLLNSGHFRSYWVSIPEGTTSVQFSGSNWWGGAWRVQDATIWSSSGSGSSGGGGNPTATPTSGGPTATPTATATATPPPSTGGD